MRVVEPRTEHVFDLSAGHLVLDFVNTMGGMRGVKPKEYLRDYADLVAFGKQAGAIPERLASRIAGEARRRPEEATAALAAAVALREALYRLFLERAEGRRARSADLDVLNGALVRAMPHRRVLDQGGGLSLGWDEAAELDAVSWPLADAAARLLTSGDVTRVRVCGMYGEGECSWLFLDRTKARTRRWCSMKDCGNRAKARRHYAKVKGKEGSETA
jgi:predicted RNA-binding Zn ribbon-like protein